MSPVCVSVRLCFISGTFRPHASCRPSSSRAASVRLQLENAHQETARLKRLFAPKKKFAIDTTASTHGLPQFPPGAQHLSSQMPEEMHTQRLSCFISGTFRPHAASSSRCKSSVRVGVDPTERGSPTNQIEDAPSAQGATPPQNFIPGTFSSATPSTFYPRTF